MSCVGKKSDVKGPEQEQECGAQQVASTLEALQTAMGSGTKLQKKPAAASSVMKRPGTHALKRPAAAVSKVKKSSGVPADAQAVLEDSRAQKRARLMSIIPSELKDQWRKGCAKCRFRAGCTPSCWLFHNWPYFGLIKGACNVVFLND